MPIAFSIETPRQAPGAIGIIRLWSGEADEMKAALAHLGLGANSVGEARCRSILGVDDGLVVRWTDTSVDLMVHGGPGVIDAIASELCKRGVKHGEGSLGDQWPEGASTVEAAMLNALATASSPRAVPVLLGQPAKHASGAERGFADASVLRHLLYPPLVLILGQPNVGKSSLLNALVGREASIVADQPGTTRDTVAAMGVLDGLTVRLADAPGMDAAESDPIVRSAAGIARTLEASADLVVRCGDRALPPPSTDRPFITVSTRSDLGGTDWPHDLAVSTHDAASLERLAIAIRGVLVPDSVLDDERPWDLLKA